MVLYLIPSLKKIQNAFTESSDSQEEDSQYKVVKQRASFIIYIYKAGREKRNLALNLNLQIISGPIPLFLLAKYFALD